jgi:hypothetical protein
MKGVKSTIVVSIGATTYWPSWTIYCSSVAMTVSLRACSGRGILRAPNRESITEGIPKNSIRYDDAQRRL